MRRTSKSVAVVVVGPAVPAARALRLEPGPAHDSSAGTAGPTSFATDALIDLGFGVLHQLELRYSSVIQFILTLQVVDY